MVTLKEICKSSPTAEAVMGALASRQRNRPVTDLRRLKAVLINERGLDIDHQEFKSLFQKLEEAGLGELISKPGTSPRFKWKKPLKDIASKATKESASLGDDALPTGNEVKITVVIGGSRMDLFGAPSDIAAVIGKLQKNA